MNISQEYKQYLNDVQQDDDNNSDTFIGAYSTNSEDSDQDEQDLSIPDPYAKYRKKFDLYKYLEQPNIILEKEEVVKYNVNTALNWKYEKLDETIWKQMVSKEKEGEKSIIRGDISYAYNTKTLEKERQLRKQTLEKITEQPEDMNNTINQNTIQNQFSTVDNEQNLNDDDEMDFEDQQKQKDQDAVSWQEYFEGKKCVYKKYDDYLLHDDKYMASILCDIRPLISQQKQENIQITQQYFGNKNDSNSSNQDQNQFQNRVYNSFTDKERNHLLEFSSDFESGNLFMAFKTGPFEYDLILQNDINTKGYTQWFFFSVKNAKKNTPYTFNIINLVRKNTLYKQGLKPLVFSEQDYQEANQWWVRDGYDVSYKRNAIKKEGNNQNNRRYYTLQFTYKFCNDNDRVFFSYSYPYTYTKLNEYLDEIQQDEFKSQFVNRKQLCKSLARNKVEQINITQNSLKQIDKRKGVVFMARQHPGEVTGSWMVEGAIDYLLEDTFEANFLRQHCIFKIFPMVNVDGVIHGNNRCSLAGVDLNRKWKNPNPKLHPEVYHSYSQVRKMNNERNMATVIDFHGHSKKLNAFFYGNNSKKRPEEPRLFPLLVSKNDRAVKYDHCRFKINQQFDSTARQALLKLLKIKTIYTLEASQLGFTNVLGGITEFTPFRYKDIGRSVCKSLFFTIFQDHCHQLSIKPPLPNIQKKKKDKNRDYIAEYHDRIQKKLKKVQNLKKKYEALEGKKLSDINQIPILRKNLQKEFQELKEIQEQQEQEGQPQEEQPEEEFSGSDSEPSIDGLDQDTMKKVMFKSFAVVKKKRSKTLNKKAEKLKAENAINQVQQIQKVESKLQQEEQKQDKIPNNRYKDKGIHLSASLGRKPNKVLTALDQMKLSKKGNSVIVSESQQIPKPKPQVKSFEPYQEKIKAKISQETQTVVKNLTTINFEQNISHNTNIRTTSRENNGRESRQSITTKRSQQEIENIKKQQPLSVLAQCNQIFVQGAKVDNPIEEYMEKNGIYVNSGLQREIQVQTDENMVGNFSEYFNQYYQQQQANLNSSQLFPGCQILDPQRKNVLEQYMGNIPQQTQNSLKNIQIKKHTQRKSLIIINNSNNIQNSSYLCKDIVQPSNINTNQFQNNNQYMPSQQQQQQRKLINRRRNITVNYPNQHKIQPPISNSGNSVQDMLQSLKSQDKQQTVNNNTHQIKIQQYNNKNQDNNNKKGFLPQMIGNSQMMKQKAQVQNTNQNKQKKSHQQQHHFQNILKENQLCSNQNNHYNSVIQTKVDNLILEKGNTYKQEQIQLKQGGQKQKENQLPTHALNQPKFKPKTHNSSVNNKQRKLHVLQSKPNNNINNNVNNNNYNNSFYI